MAGLGHDEFPGFPADVCPEKMPDLSEHNNIMAEVLRANPGIWGKYWNKNTPLGVSFAKCIKTGSENILLRI
jgi:hypothetical protein